MSRKGFAAALLLAALSARAPAQVRPAAELRPVFSLAPAPGPLEALAPSALTPALSFTALAAPSAPVSAAAPAPLPPARARAAAIGAALADFARTDLEAASAGDSRDAGEALMLRALGASAPESAAPAAAAGAPAETLVPPLAARRAGREVPEPKVYLLSNPLRETVRLGPAAVVLHLAYWAGWEATKAVIAYQATGSIAAAAAVFAYEFTTSPVMITARSLGHLGLRYWRRKLGVLKELARAPGVTRVKILTTGDVAFTGPLARRMDNTGLIFIEAREDLPQALGRFGAPIPLGDVASNRVRLAFVREGAASPASWTPTLKDLLDRRPIPPETAAAWRAAAKGAKEARIEATLIRADGSERPIGAIARGPGARRLVGLGLLDRARRLLGAGSPSRAIPLSDSVVERPGGAREAGAKAALSRAWRRLTGRLIVAGPG